MAMHLIDIAGQRFGRLVALEYLGKAGRFKWRCGCDCGATAHVNGHQLRTGGTRSCGCLDRETLMKRNTKHGLSQSAEYGIYLGMVRRCLSHGDGAQYYEGRGIEVCQRWLVGEDGKSGFEAFLEDMGPRPSSKLSIDRIDNDGNYEPGNCRWATIKQQANNKRSNRIVEAFGAEMTLAEAAERAGLPYYVVHDRVNKLGWPLAEALSKKTIGRWA